MVLALPPSERPRERLLFLGEGALSDVELLALVMGSSSVAGCDVLQVARELILNFNGLHALEHADLKELTAVRGIGEAKAARLKAALELGRRAHARIPEPGQTIRSGRDVARWFRTTLGHLPKEVFWALGLDSKNRLLRPVRVAEGHLGGVEVHPREAFTPLMRMGARSAIFVHNHPSGDPEPSQEDVALTMRLLEAGRLLGIRVLDHVVVGRRGHESLIERVCGEVREW